MKNLFFIPLLAMIISCQPTRITQSWTAKNTAPKKFKKILVLAVLPSNETDLQVKMENNIADEMHQLGYLAIAANKMFPAGTFVRGDTMRARNAISGRGFDGLMTIVMLDKKKEKYFVPGRITDMGYFNNYNRFDDYFNRIGERIYAPGYYGEETKYFWENNFYDLGAKQMIYSAHTRSFDITSKKQLAGSYASLIARHLVEKNILIKPEKLEEE